MTTMTTETVTLPLARLNRSLAAAGGPEVGEHPYLAVPEGAPAGYDGCFIMPADSLAGWAITSAHPAPVRPYEGMRGWWVRAGDITVLDTTSEVEMPDVGGTGGVIDDRIPAEYHSVVPEGAYWVRMTQAIDGLRQQDLVLAMDDPEGRARGPVLLFWPGHQHHRDAATNRPGLPEGWRGWWAHGHATRVDSVRRASQDALVDRPDLPFTRGQRVRVIRDGDMPANAGRIAEIIEYSAGGLTPFRVRYDDGEPGGTYGWWIHEAVPVGPPVSTTSVSTTPVYPNSAEFLPGHWYSWNSQHDWFRVGQVTDVGVEFDRLSNRDGRRIRTETRRYSSADIERHRASRNLVVLPPGHSDLPAGLRQASINEADLGTLMPVGTWFTWGARAAWYRVSSIEGSRVRTDRRFMNEEVREHGDTYAPRDLMGDRFVCLPSGHERLPGTLRTYSAEPVTAEPTAEPTVVFEPGMRVLLTSPHVMTPTDTGGYSEARRGVGRATAVLEHRATGDGQWHVRWDHGGNPSVLHECCITPLPTREPVVGDRVILISDHVTRPGGTTFNHESPYGVGSIGVLDQPGHDGRFGIRWLNDDGSESRHSTIHVSCLAVMPDVGVTEAPGPVWIEGVPDEHAASVPDNAVWQTHRGGTLGDRDYICVPNPDYAGRWSALMWPGHPAWEHGTGGRAEVPTGWRSFRTTAGWSNRRDVVRTTEPTSPTVEPETTVVMGWEGVPEEHWAQVPENAVKVRYTMHGNSEWLAYPHNGGHMLIAWPGHRNNDTMVRADHAGRLAEGVPPGWTSWYTTGATEVGPWPRVAPPEGEVARLQAELAAVQRRYAEDMERIASIMKDEADRREWCAEYEEVARRINREVHADFAGERPIEYEVLFAGMVPFDGRINLTLPPDPTEEQVRDALRSHFEEQAATLSHYATVDFSECNVGDLSVTEFDEA